MRRPQTIWQCAESGGGIAAERVGLQRHRRLEEPRQCPTGVASRRYHHTKSQTRTGLGRLEARGSDKRSFSARAERNSLVTIESRFPPHGGLGLSVPLLALSDNLHSRCAAISDGRSQNVRLTAVSLERPLPQSRPIAAALHTRPQPDHPARTQGALQPCWTARPLTHRLGRPHQRTDPPR